MFVEKSDAAICARIKEIRGDVVEYGHLGGLNPFQEDAVRYYVKGKHVYDLGAGLLGYAKRIAELGAGSVTAVDQIYKDRRENVYNYCRTWAKCAPPGVQLDSSSFREFYLGRRADLDVAFISWPDNAYGKTMGLELIAQKAKTVIYLGKNLDGTACGSPQLWNMLTRRKVLCFLPAVRNSLIVYGPELEQPRKYLLEEKGAVDGPWDNILYSPPDWPTT